VAERELQKLQPVVSVTFPVRGELKTEAGCLLVTDESGRPVPFRLLYFDRRRNEARVIFRSRSAGRYRILYDGRTAVDSGLDLVPGDTGQVILEDYLYPDIRTSGIWLWTESPRLSGVLSHTQPEGSGTFHSAWLNPNVHYRAGDYLTQYVYLDPARPPEEIMVEVTVRNRRIAFSWGPDRMQWKELKKVRLGDLPAAGRWQPLKIDLTECGREGDITTLAFYNQGGRAWWDRTCLFQPEAVVRPGLFEERDRKVSAYFTSRVIGPLLFQNQRFFLVNLDGRSSGGATGWEWRFEEKKSSESEFWFRSEGKSGLPVRLTVTGPAGRKAMASDTWTDTVQFPTAAAQELKFLFRELSHQSLINTGETLYLNFLVTNLTPVPLPLTVTDGRESRSLWVLPGKDNSRIADFTIKTSGQPEVRDYRLLAGDLELDRRSFRVQPLGEGLTDIAAAGPYLSGSRGERLVLEVPEFRLENGTALDTGREISIGIFGDGPPGLASLLKESLARRGVRAAIHEEPGTDTEGYHLLTDSLRLLHDRPRPGYDLALLFPSLPSLRRRSPVQEWRRSMEIQIWALKGRVRRLALVSPLPAAPFAALFQPYAGAAAEAAGRHGAGFVDAHLFYTGLDDWPRFFRTAPRVYGNFPDPAGLKLLADYLAAGLF